jgi:hypothetical protein
MTHVFGKWTRIFLYLATFPMDVVALVLGVLVRVTWGRLWHVEAGVLVVELDSASWPVRTWYRRWGGTTVSHLVILNGALGQDSLEKVFEHELVHVEQCEANAVAGLFVALGATLGGPAWVGLLIWAVLPAIIYGAASLTAVLRGESGYRGNHLEEAAYDATEKKD